MKWPRPHKIEVHLDEKQYAFVKEYMEKRGIEHEEGVMWQALIWLNKIERTEGAREAVQALMPQLPSKKPTIEELEAFFNNA